MNEPHGNIYAAVSHYVAQKYNQSLWCPASILKNYEPTENLRLKYNIPKDAMVIGRHGGNNTFNIPFVKSTVKNTLDTRPDLYFLFLSTEKFITHERVIFLPWVETEQEKFNFIHACDAMLHARIDGETFGTAVAEFSIANKPVITFRGINTSGYDTCHLELLGDKAMIYNNELELSNILFNIDKPLVSSTNWDMYSKYYNQKSVINRFKEVYLS
jgi:glycosyltransferase involved in cell wall biosynthesis